MSKKNLLILVAVLVLIIAGVFLIKRQQLNKAPVLIEKAESTLSPANQIFVQKRLKENLEKISQWDEKTSIIEKVDLYFVVSVDQRALGDYGEAKKTLETAMSIDPKNSNLISTYSSLLALMGDKKGALVYIDKAISLYPLEDNYWNWKITLERDLGRTSFELENTFKDALKQTKNDLNIIVLYAKFLEGEKRYSDSIKQWEEAIKIEPSLKVQYQSEIDRLKSL